MGAAERVSSVTLFITFWLFRESHSSKQDPFPLWHEISSAETWGIILLSLMQLFMKEMRIPDHLTCLLRNLYAGQETTVRPGHGPTYCFQIGKGVHQGCILSSCLFNFYAEYIMRNAGLEEAQAGIKIARGNINNLRYADDTTLMAESKNELKKPLDEGERGEWKSWLKVQHSEN